MLKACLKVLGSKFSEQSAQRVARAIGQIDQIMKSVDSDSKMSVESKTRSQTDPREAVKQIVSDLQAAAAFVHTPGREGYPSFPKMSANLLEGLDYRDMHSWMREKLSEWEKMYEY